MKTTKEIRDALGVLKTEKETLDKIEEKTDEQSKRYLEVLDEGIRLLDELKIAERSEQIDDSFIVNEAPPLEIKPNAETDEYRFGEWIKDCMYGAKNSRWSPRLENHQKRAKEEIRAITGLSELIPADGGFLLTTDYSSELIKNAHETGKLVSKCRKIPISKQAGSIVIPGVDETSRVAGSRTGGVQMYWAGEGDEKTASKPKFRRITLQPHKLVGLVYTTDELNEDVAALESFVKSAFAEEMGFKMDEAIIEGTGAGQPLGIDNSGALVSVAKETGQAATSIVAENIEKMYARMMTTSVANGIWLINQDCWPQLFQLHHAVGTGGVPMFMLPGSLPDAPAGALLGRPVMAIEQCETLGTKGDIYFVDLSKYYITDKGAMQSALSMHVRFIYDETVLRFVYRVDGQPSVNSALTPFKGTNTQSPFITLDARA